MGLMKVDKYFLDGILGLDAILPNYLLKKDDSFTYFGNECLPDWFLRISNFSIDRYNNGFKQDAINDIDLYEHIESFFHCFFSNVLDFCYDDFSHMKFDEEFIKVVNSASDNIRYEYDPNFYFLKTSHDICFSSGHFGSGSGVDLCFPIVDGSIYQGVLNFLKTVCC